jgi:putative membrane protein insertion efficiency factor
VQHTARLVDLPKAGLLGVIRLYQHLVAPSLPPACRYQPTCSHYAYSAVERYGPFKGGWLTLKRLGRCHPFGGSGFDPVP